jgi:hypothetical protein
MVWSSQSRNEEPFTRKGARHRAGEVVTQHGRGAQGEKPLEPAGIQLVQNLVSMNESCDSRSNTRTVLFRNTPCSK